jgi:hypothetical protein
MSKIRSKNLSDRVARFKDLVQVQYKEELGYYMDGVTSVIPIAGGNYIPEKARALAQQLEIPLCFPSGSRYVVEGIQHDTFHQVRKHLYIFPEKKIHIDSQNAIKRRTKVNRRWKHVDETG